jgi:signal transduction histidine kinase
MPKSIHTEEISGRSLLKASRFILISILFLIAGFILDPQAHREGQVKIKPAEVERDFHRKLTRLDHTADKLLTEVTREGWPGAVEVNPQFANTYSDENDGIALFLIRNDSVMFWTDNSLVVSARDLKSISTDKMYTLPNCNVYCRVFEKGDYKLVGMAFLKKFFPYNNEYVSNAFLVGTGIPASYRISYPPVPGAVQISDDKGNYAFTIVPGEEGMTKATLHWITLLMFVLFFIFLLIGYSDVLRLCIKIMPGAWWLLVVLADMFLLRWLFGLLEAPHCIFRLPLFTPFQNGVFLLESRGGVLMTTLLLIFFAFWFTRLFNLFPRSMSPDKSKTDNRFVQSIGLAGWLMVGITFLVMHWITGFLLTERPGLLEINRILAFSQANVTDTLIIVGLQVAFLMIAYRTIGQMKHRITWIQALISMLITSGLLFGVGRTATETLSLIDIAYYLLTVGALIFFHYAGRTRLTHGFAAALIFLLSVFLVMVTDEFNRSKENLRQAGILERLSNEHDQIAEMLLPQIDEQIRNDTLLRNLVINPDVNPLEKQSTITSFLKTQYFGLYWNRYEIQARSCDSVSRILIQPDNFEVPCLPYFLGDMRDQYGSRLPGTEGFYYLDNFDGLIDYLGVYRFFKPDSTYGANLIINIDSRLVAQEMGYPELLVTGRINRDSLYGNYSYAKYNKGKLQSVNGSFDYGLTSEAYPGKVGEIVPFIQEGYHHWIYRINEDNEIVISRPTITFTDYVITFSYVFVFLFAIWFLLYQAVNFKKALVLRNLGLKQRIQLTLVSILVFSFVLIGGGMTYFVIKQYKDSNRKLIVEKTESLLTDLQHKLEKEHAISATWSDNTYRSLDELLLKFSYVFNTDMNMYDPNGILIVSTRPEVFEYNLAGKMMNPLAYDALHYQKKTRFIIRESIESLGYYSSYVPLFNQEGKLLGYLNLPYFSRQSEIRREISTIVIAMLNGYFILIMLSIFFAVLLANQVSRPLHQLQSKLAGLRFGRKNVEIDYRRDDEVGKLVKEYNRMVSELQASAEKLARSERESAWREMARQIAHEIKNPLTPMKLSVQHLRRAWKDQAPNLDQHIDKVTHTLIDQIDTLSSIASEFSKFAQMPGAHFEPTEMISRIKRVTYLFEDSCRVILHPVDPPGTEALVYADPEQLLQVFNNLIRNAIQAVPENREPEVDIYVSVGNGKVLVKVADNGTGIPDEQIERMFEPNFTTKSSGTGLGLAITKKIVEGAEGRIWFETQKDKGTTFFIEWPLYHPE